MFPFTSSVDCGLVVPMPTLPLAGNVFCADAMAPLAIKSAASTKQVDLSAPCSQSKVAEREVAASFAGRLDASLACPKLIRESPKALSLRHPSGMCGKRAHGSTRRREETIINGKDWQALVMSATAVFKTRLSLAFEETHSHSLGGKSERLFARPGWLCLLGKSPYRQLFSVSSELFDIRLTTIGGARA